MPIKPENRARYPKDWLQIRQRILERAGHKCEACGVGNHWWGYRDHDGKFHLTYWEENKCLIWPAAGECEDLPSGETSFQIVLTVAHLGRPAHFPVQLHVARTAKASEIIRMVGLFMASESEQPEWANMMHRRVLSEFGCCAPTIAAPFVIAFAGGVSTAWPRRAVSHQPLAMTPEYAVLTGWRLLSKPLQATHIAAKAPAMSQVESTNSIHLPAAFADGLSKATFCSTDGFITTGWRTGLDAISGLLRAKLENFPTYAAHLLSETASGWPTNTRAFDPASIVCSESAGAACGARSALSLRIVHETLGADDAIKRRRAFSWTSHPAILFHLDEYIENCSDENLKALCQRCHLAYDHEHHQRNARETRRGRKAVADLFEGVA